MYDRYKAQSLAVLFIKCDVDMQNECGMRMKTIVFNVIGSEMRDKHCVERVKST